MDGTECKHHNSINSYYTTEEEQESRPQHQPYARSVETPVRSYNPVFWIHFNTLWFTTTHLMQRSLPEASLVHAPDYTHLGIPHRYLGRAKETLYGTFQDPRKDWATSIQIPDARDMDGPPGIPYFLTQEAECCRFAGGRRILNWITRSQRILLRDREALKVENSKEKPTVEERVFNVAEGLSNRRSTVAPCRKFYKAYESTKTYSRRWPPGGESIAMRT